MYLEYPKDQLLNIAKSHRYLILSILGLIGLAVFFGMTSAFVLSQQGDGSSGAEAIMVVFVLGALVFGIGQLIFFFRLAFALDVGAIATVLYLLGLFIPLLSLGVLIWLSSKASKIIKEHGYKVGFLGADIKAIEQDTIANSADVFS